MTIIEAMNTDDIIVGKRALLENAIRSHCTLTARARRRDVIDLLRTHYGISEEESVPIVDAYIREIADPRIRKRLWD